MLVQSWLKVYLLHELYNILIITMFKDTSNMVIIILKNKKIKVYYLSSMNSS